MTPEETRKQEIADAFNLPENQELLNSLVDGFNHIYSEQGLNMIVQVHSKEDANGRSWIAYIEDNYSIPDQTITVQVTPDKAVSEPVVSSNGI